MIAPTIGKSGRIGAVLSVLVLSSLACSLGSASGAAATSAPSQAGSVTPASPASTPASETQSAASGSCSNPLYPVVQGATYSYKTASTLGGSSYTKTITAVRPDGFTVTEDFQNNTKLTKEWGCTADGLISLSPVSGDSASVTSDKSTMTIDTTTNTGVTFPTTITAGQTWTQTIEAKGKMTVKGVEVDRETVTTQTFTAVAMESVSVPAGTFNAMKITAHAVVHITETLMGQSHSSDIPSDSTLWYAPDVGEVKSTGTAFGGLTGSTELVSYKVQ